MTIEFSDVEKSHEIFAYLLEYRELSEKDETELYRAYTESDTIQTLVQSQGEMTRCHIARYSDVIYLIPYDDNRFLGYSKSDLKQELCKAGATDKDYYLAQFSILVLLVEFYDGQGPSSKTRDFIRLGELQNSIADHLRQGVELMDEDMQSEEGIAYTAMFQVYDSMRSDPERKKVRTTKEGFLRNILHFLQDQGLICFIERDDIIKTTRKLDHFMDWNLLNRENYAHVSAVLGGHPDE